MGHRLSEKHVKDKGDVRKLSFTSEEKRQNARDGAGGKPNSLSIAEAASNKADKTPAPDMTDMSNRALPTPPTTKKCNWGILGFGAPKKSPTTKHNSNWARSPNTKSNSNWASGPKSPEVANKEITSTAKIAASDKRTITTRPPTPTKTTTTNTEPPKLPQKLNKPSAFKSQGNEAANQAERQVVAKTPIKTAKQENGVCEETAKEATGAKTSSLAIAQPTPPPRRRRSSGQRWKQLQT